MDAMDAKLMSKYTNYNEELEIKAVDGVGIYATGENLKKYIPSIEDEDLKKFVVIKSKLLYVGTDEKETEIADRLGIGGGSETSDAGATVKEVQAIVDGVVKVSEENKEKIPKNDSDRLEELECTDDEKGLIGTRLFDRNGLNLTARTWNILIEYDNQNKETARYGTGYYWLKKGETYTIKREKIEFKNDYVINYGNEEFMVLSGRSVNWNEEATLGVSENLALNLDPMSFAVGIWRESDDIDEVKNKRFEDFIVKDTDGVEKNTGIQKVGDVKYNDENKSLEFNRKDTIDESMRGYIKLKGEGLDFSRGFTFEMYMNCDNLEESWSNGALTMKGSALFCKTPRLIDESFTQSMRFGFLKDKFWCRFSDYDYSVSETGENMFTQYRDGIFCEDYKINSGENKYISVVYSAENSNGKDHLSYFVDGNLVGDLWINHGQYQKGLDVWGDNSPFFIGALEASKQGFIYYFKGSVFATRLYTVPLMTDEVKLNYDMTLKYRDSFKDEMRTEDTKDVKPFKS